MPPTKRPGLSFAAHRANVEQLARVGQEVRLSRRRRRLSQGHLGARVGLGKSTISLIELGRGGGLTLDTWQRIGVALGREFRIELARDRLEEPADADHLLIQELLLRLARERGHTRSFELPTRDDPRARSADVLIRDDVGRRLVIAEAWNSIGDIGAAARSTNRKITEAGGLAASLGREGSAYSVHAVWVVRATARNRALLEGYPEVFATRFPGSSRAWVAAITAGEQPPSEPGLIWCDIGCSRVYEWRRR